MKLRESTDNFPRKNLVDMVSGRIIDWIIKGEIKPGEKLPSEKEMMLHFKVSKSVIREAISSLNALQMVDTLQGKGSFVVHKSREAIMYLEVDIFEVELSNHLREIREIFEPQIAKLAAQRASESDLNKLLKSINELDAAIQHNEMGYHEDDILHYILVQSTHNPLLEKIMIYISRMSEPYKRLSLAQPFRSAETRVEWHAIIQAVEKQDALAACQAMYRHIQNSMGNKLEFSPRAIEHKSENQVKSKGS